MRQGVLGWRVASIGLALLACVLALLLIAQAALFGAVELRPGGEPTPVGFDPRLAGEGLLVGIWPFAIAFAVVRRLAWLAWSALAMFTALALLFGFGAGGPHLTTTLPCAWLAVLLAAVDHSTRRPQADAGGPSA